MGSRYEVELTVGSTRDLKSVNWRNGDLKLYVILWVDAGAKCSTRVGGESPPYWDEKLVVPSSFLQDAVLYLDVLHTDAAQGFKPLVGSTRLPLHDVLDDAPHNLRLIRPSGRPQGRLHVRVAVREPSRYYDPNPAAYPAPAGYSQPSVGGAYGAYGAGAVGGYASMLLLHPAYAAAYGSAPPPTYGTTTPVKKHTWHWQMLDYLFLM